MSEAGSLRAIIHEVKTGSFYTFIDEILHSWVFDWAIGNFGWRRRFCQWSNGELAVKNAKALLQSVTPLTMQIKAELENGAVIEETKTIN